MQLLRLLLRLILRRLRLHQAPLLHLLECRLLLQERLLLRRRQLLLLLRLQLLQRLLCLLAHQLSLPFQCLSLLLLLLRVWLVRRMLLMNAVHLPRVAMRQQGLRLSQLELSTNMRHLMPQSRELAACREREERIGRAHASRGDWARLPPPRLDRPLVGGRGTAARHYLRAHWRLGALSRDRRGERGGRTHHGNRWGHGNRGGHDNRGGRARAHQSNASLWRAIRRRDEGAS